MKGLAKKRRKTGKRENVLVESVSPFNPEIKMAALQAAAALELATRKQIPPAIVEFRQPFPTAQPRELPGNIPCDCSRIVANSANRSLTFDRQGHETLAEFQEKAVASIPRDAQFWLVLPEPIILATGDAIPVSSGNLATIQFAPDFAKLFTPGFRYKVWFGGRGAGKSWQFARTLILLALLKKIRVGCFRELQNSIRDSVHQVIREQIDMMGYSPYFEVTDKTIRCTLTGSDFIFKGLRANATEIKSTEGIDLAWVEEAQLVSKDSWEILTPTIRKENSEIWVSFNPIDEEDPTYAKFISQTPPEMIRKMVNWHDNPFFNEALNKERRWMEQADPDAYEHVWNGGCRTISDNVIFRGKYVIDVFEAPTNPPPERFYFGADFGFANDPATLVRMYITGKAPEEELWIEYEAWGVGVELNEMPQLYDSVPGSRVWPILADNSQPQVISYLEKQHGFNITAADKWTGCVEDGIAHLKGFKLIHIHQRCIHSAEEARLYSYKRDRLTNEVLPIVLDKWNHIWDAVRYALTGFIQGRGLASIWARL